MKPNRIALLLAFLIPYIQACVTTTNVGILNIEVMKPSVFTFKQDSDNIAVFVRDRYQSDTLPRFTMRNYVAVEDTLVSNRTLSKACAGQFASSAEQYHYFKSVHNFSDSLNNLFPENISSEQMNTLHDSLGYSVFLFLDYFVLLDNRVRYLETDNVHVVASVIWSISVKSDTNLYVLNQNDTLFWNSIDNPALFKNNARPLMLENSARFMGESMAGKLTPSWNNVERMYYKSNNPEMLKAEKYMKAGDWNNAADVWKKETANKNPNIAAKAKYNLALACEMEGRPKTGINWLADSYNSYKVPNKEHQANCQRYINILALRKKEIELLSKQLNSEDQLPKN